MTTARVYEIQLAQIRYKCDKFVQFHQCPLPKLLTIKWLDALKTDQRLVI